MPGDRRALWPLSPAPTGSRTGHGAVTGALRAVVAGGGVPAPGTVRADRWVQEAGRGAHPGGLLAFVGPVAGSRRAHGQGGHLRAESRRRPHPGVGGSLDHSSPGAGRRHDSGGSGGVVGTAQELGVSAAGINRAAGTEGEGRIARGAAVAHRRASDRAVAGGQPGGSSGGHPARGAQHCGVSRGGGPVARLRRTAPARVPAAASARSVVAGPRSTTRGTRPAIERNRKPRVEARGAAAGCAGPYGSVVGASGSHRADAGRSRDSAAALPTAGAGCGIGSSVEPRLRR